MKTFRQAVAQERRKREMSRAELSGLTNISASAIYQFEKGRSDISLARAYAIAKTLDISLDKFRG